MKLAPRITRSALAVGGVAVLIASLTGCSGGLGGGSASTGDKSVTSNSDLQHDTTITLLTGNDPASIAQGKAYADGFHKAEPKVTVKIDGSKPAGGDGDNYVKTKLSTGDMDDVFLYNSGSLFQALDPDKTLQPLGNEPWVEDVDANFKTTVSTSKGFYGAPVGTSFAGGVLYNKKVYAKLGLSVPTTWAQFLANSKKIKAAGITPVLQTYGDTWTAQLFVLGSFANISAADSSWAKQYTANDASAKYAKQPALEGFQHTQQVHDLGLLNKDYAALTNVNGLKELAEGKAAQYPMLGVVISNVQQSNPDQVNDIGIFPLPADNGADTRLTVWEPGAAYIPTSTTGDKLIAAKKFVAWMNSSAGCAVQNKVVAPSGPYSISTCKLPSTVNTVVSDTQQYVQQGKAGVALEFLSAIKGPNLEKILIQVGSGISTAAQGAALYDEDVKKQAQQLGLSGWN
ncbi:ABC transporter substrate-binding protein [Amnibacterium kyonggiense]|uniref:Carbohydrate ABC transporter substrate-binding protein (CUT1 family) n=1 Tax=Amnibacterium kyonggiense TaxID=595671 RepID=A0A4R7FKE0_9MICO|nr:ABC transporter substrate-binding protein [Amnibacterium kyonggiense]TDS76823.1 carbohydrate ABC transporter substrate-binding protein (CUT1 family) [Amnibacterium kyonggiense]